MKVSSVFVKEDLAHDAGLHRTYVGLIECGLRKDADTRVDPLHVRKMTARVQAANAGEAPILMRYHTKTGHFGGLPLTEQIEEGVDVLAFLRWRLGRD